MNRLNNNPSNAGIPLSDFLSVDPQTPECVLVYDSVDSDGRFVLYDTCCRILSPSCTAANYQYSQSQSQPQCQSNRVLWLSTGSITEQIVANSLKKMECPAAINYLRGLNRGTARDAARNDSNTAFSRIDGDSSLQQPLTIRSITAEISAAILQETPGEASFDAFGFLQTLYNDIKAWVLQSHDAVADTTGSATTTHQMMAKAGKKSTAPPCWLIVDDLTTLGSILGERVVYSWISSLRALSSTTPTRTTQTKFPHFGLVLRCSHDTYDPKEIASRSGQHLAGDDGTGRKSMVGGGGGGGGPLSSGSIASTFAGRRWFGAGGRHCVHEESSSSSFSMMGSAGHHPQQEDAAIPWERSLVELADRTVDVMPLTSGYTREAHGRLILTHPTSWIAAADLNKNNTSSNNNNNTSSTSSIHSESDFLAQQHRVVNFCLTDNSVRALPVRRS